MGQALQQNQYWNALKQKSPDEVVPYIQSALKGMGKLDLLLNFFMPGGGKK